MFIDVLLLLVAVIAFAVYAKKKGWIGGAAATEVAEVEADVKAEETKVVSAVKSDVTKL